MYGLPDCDVSAPRLAIVREIHVDGRWIHLTCAVLSGGPGQIDESRRLAAACLDDPATRRRVPPTGIHIGNTLTDLIVPKGGLRMNPEWAEWFMGFPTGWTDLRPLATDRFRQWLSAHGAN